MFDFDQNGHKLVQKLWGCNETPKFYDTVNHTRLGHGAKAITCDVTCADPETYIFQHTSRIKYCL